MKKVVLCTRNYIRDAMKLSGSEIIIECFRAGSVLGIRYYIYPDSGRLVVSSDHAGFIQSKGHWLVYGPVDHRTTGSRGLEHGDQNQMFKIGIDSSFRPRSSVCQ